MELLLLADIPGLGKTHDIVVVDDATRLTLCSKQQAFVATPTIRNRFAFAIKRRALERENPSPPKEPQETPTILKHPRQDSTGGTTTKERYGHDFYAEIGKKGGRPKHQPVPLSDQ